MEHLCSLLGSEPHNGLKMQRLTSLFDPLIFCMQIQQQIRHKILKANIINNKFRRKHNKCKVQNPWLPMGVNQQQAKETPLCTMAMSKWIRCVPHKRPRLYECCLTTGQETLSWRNVKKFVSNK
jgi:hypothetical protein